MDESSQPAVGAALIVDDCDDERVQISRSYPFEYIWTEIIEQGKGTLLLACVNDQSAAGVLSSEWKDTPYYKFGATNRALM